MYFCTNKLNYVNNKIKYNNLKGKQMKRNLLRLGLSLIALFVMVVANAQTYQNEEASVSWRLMTPTTLRSTQNHQKKVLVWFP